MEMDKERKARLEKMVANERLRLAMEKMVATERLRLAMEMDQERKARLENGSYYTAQVSPGDRGRKRS